MLWRNEKVTCYDLSFELINIFRRFAKQQNLKRKLSTFAEFCLYFTGVLLVTGCKFKNIKKMASQTLIFPVGTQLIPIHSVKENQEEKIPNYAVGLFDKHNGPGPRKRKRLTHLTSEEKVQRRKLKNRVAAQSARDRKKNHMMHLEESITNFKINAEDLIQANKSLVEQLAKCQKENEELRKRLGLGKNPDFNVSEQEKNLSRIQREYNEVVAKASSAGDIKEEVTISNSLPSPPQSSSSDENDTRPSSPSVVYVVESSDGTKQYTTAATTTTQAATVVDCQHGNNDASAVIDQTRCRSPKPAVFGEHEYKEIVLNNPQQQEAGNFAPIPLINLNIDHSNKHHHRHRNNNNSSKLVQVAANILTNLSQNNPPPHPLLTRHQSLINKWRSHRIQINSNRSRLQNSSDCLESVIHNLKQSNKAQMARRSAI